MNILAIDTIDDILSSALSTKAGVWYSEIDAGARHSELLLESIVLLFSSSGIKPEKLNLIACLQGPGSFTGLRIGFSTAKGLGMALGVPITAVPTLDCIAYPLNFWPGLVIPVIDAKRGCFFTALYRGKNRLTEYMDAAPETIIAEIKKVSLPHPEPLILTGSGAVMLFPFLAATFPDIILNPHSRNGRAKELLEIAKDIKIDNNSVFSSVPVYIRKSDAEINGGRKQQIGF